MAFCDRFIMMQKKKTHEFCYVLYAFDNQSFSFVVVVVIAFQNYECDRQL